MRQVDRATISPAGEKQMKSIDAIAKTVAEMTSQQGGVIRQQLIEHPTCGIMHYDGEFAVNSRPLQSAT